MGGNRRKDHPQKGTAPRPPRQRLAKRKARKEQLVKFGLCPVTSEYSTAQKVRKSQQSSARAHADVTSTEQNGLEPHPAARQGASRARNCAATSVFSFDGSTAVFFLPPQKENGGGLMQVITCHHAPFGAAGPWRLLAGGKWGWKAIDLHRYPRPVDRPTHTALFFQKNIPCGESDSALQWGK